MTSAQPGDNFEQRMNRLEAMMNSAGQLLMTASQVAQRNAADIKFMHQRLRRQSSDMQFLTQTLATLASQMSNLTQRRILSLN
ncbi:MAG: hypothetical protein ACFBSF_22640 [Leptolyngbyaceae cyanobacterium]